MHNGIRLSTLWIFVLSIVMLGLALPTHAMADGPRLNSFWIVDADTDTIWKRLTLDDLIDLDHAPQSLNIIVESHDTVASVVFTLDGVQIQTENAWPYAMGGDNSGDYAALELSTGFHIIEATGYTGPDGTGEAGPSAVISLEIGRSDFDVDTTIDAPDTSPGDGVCATRKQLCSLRAAIEEANSLNGRQWIHVPNGIYPLQHGMITVTDRVTVRGESMLGVQIDGEGSRAFWISSLRTDFDELTITGAHGNDGGGAFTVEKGAELKLLDVEISGNTANGGPGAGLFNNGKTTIRRSRFDDNNASFDGPLCGGGMTADAGAIFNQGTLSVHRSSFTNNRAVRGGAILNNNVAVISNTTFSGNRARGGGGAIYNKEIAGREAKLHLAYSTLTQNEANVPCRNPLTREPDNKSVGGGLYNTGSATIGSSIIAQNIDHRDHSDSQYSPDCWSGSLGSTKGKLTSAGRNVWGELNEYCGLRYPNNFLYSECAPAQVDLAGCAIQPGDQIRRDKWGVPTAPLDAGLNTLSGFPLPAHTIAADSPALDFGGSLPLAFVFIFCPDSDQTQRVRPSGTPQLCDAGARER